MNFNQNYSKQLNPGTRILVVTAVDAERDAVLHGLGDNNNVDVLDVGVGPIAAAVETTKVMTIIKYNLVVCAGIAGGFIEHSKVGSLVVADEIVAVDLGVETQDGFYGLDEMSLGPTRFQVDPHLINQLIDPFCKAGLSVVTGPILTVSTVTGTTTTAKERAKRVPRAAAEAMEGFGIATVAQTYGVPFLELRAISNLVGPRDRDKWRIKEALEVLSTASSVLGKLFK